MSSFATRPSATMLEAILARCPPTRCRSTAQEVSVPRSARRRSVVLGLTLAGALAACAAPATEPGRVGWLGQDEHRIVVTAEAFSDAEVMRVGFRDSWQREEYALFKADERQLELIFAEARKSFSVALDYQMPITTMVPTWNANARRDLAWGPLGRFDWGPGTWFYRTYRQVGIGPPCVGLQVEWDEIYEDPMTRPRRVLFGYACGIAGQDLDDEDVRDLIRGIAVRPHDDGSAQRYSRQRARRNPVAPPSPDADDAVSPAIAVAKGQGAFGDRGNPSFPFAFARYFSESDGGRRP